MVAAAGRSALVEWLLGQTNTISLAKVKMNSADDRLIEFTGRQYPIDANFIHTLGQLLAALGPFLLVQTLSVGKIFPFRNMSDDSHCWILLKIWTISKPERSESFFVFST